VPPAARGESGNSVSLPEKAPCGSRYLKETNPKPTAWIVRTIQPRDASLAVQIVRGQTKPERSEARHFNTGGQPCEHST
jgi:hypothetical protein